MRDTGQDGADSGTDADNGVDLCTSDSADLVLGGIGVQDTVNNTLAASLSRDGGQTLVLEDIHDVPAATDNALTIVVDEKTTPTATVEMGWTKDDSTTSQWGVIVISIIETAAGATPKGPLGHPLYGPFAGPIAA